MRIIYIYTTMLKIKKWYLNFLERDNKNPGEVALKGILYLLSGIYGLVVVFKNVLYDKKILSVYAASGKVVSVGNLCWGGSGKTPLTIWLYEKMFRRYKTCVLRRGYGRDEEKMLEEKGIKVFSFPQRERLIEKLSSAFDVFILDDAFQYRKLKRDVDIVIMGAREFGRKIRLIPANIFREPLTSLRRADILILNWNSAPDPSAIKELLYTKFPQLKIYLARYRCKRFVDLDNRDVDINSLKTRNLAAFCAIGYPEGFFDKLKQLNLKILRRITYPDHYELSEKEFTALCDSLLKENIDHLVITQKDKYHFPLSKGQAKLNIVIMEIEMEIEKESEFLNEVEEKLDVLQH